MKHEWFLFESCAKRVGTLRKIGVDSDMQGRLDFPPDFIGVQRPVRINLNFDVFFDGNASMLKPLAMLLN
jgi:hypothetical protein